MDIIGFLVEQLAFNLIYTVIFFVVALFFWKKKPNFTPRYGPGIYWVIWSVVVFWALILLPRGLHRDFLEISAALGWLEFILFAYVFEFLARQTSERLSSSPSRQAASPESNDLWEKALREINTHSQHQATWARAIVEANGDPERTKAAYIRLRVKSSI